MVRAVERAWLGSGCRAGIGRQKLESLEKKDEPMETVGGFGVAPTGWGSINRRGRKWGMGRGSLEDSAAEEVVAAVIYILL